MSEQEKKQTGKGLLVVSIVAIVVVAALIGVIVFLLVSKDTKQEEKPREVLVTEDNVEEFLENLQEQDLLEDTLPGYYTVTMVLDWHFKTGDEASYDAYVVNVEQNTNDVYFDVVLEEDESKVLYSSPILPRGSRLDDIKLDTKLSAGQYKCVCIYHLVDENQESISQVRIGFRINIEG